MTTTRKTATAAEALGDRIPFSFGGVDYLLIPSSEWDYEVLIAFDEGKVSRIIEGLLGAEQHAAFRATKPKLDDVTAFILGAQKALGISGN